MAPATAASKYRSTPVCAAAVWATASHAALAEDKFKIGLILPMTGPFASTGKQIEAAARLYMAQNGDTVAGKKVELIVKDDTSAPDVTKRLAQELVVNDKVSVLAGFGLKAPSRFDNTSANFVRQVMGKAQELDKQLAQAGLVLLKPSGRSVMVELNPDFQESDVPEAAAPSGSEPQVVAPGPTSSAPVVEVTGAQASWRSGSSRAYRAVAAAITVK